MTRPREDVDLELFGGLNIGSLSADVWLVRVEYMPNPFYNLPGSSGSVHANTGTACKTLLFEIVEKTI